MNQSEFTGIFCERPQNFAWFLGAGASRTAGLPTATDIIWDLKRRYYCQQENQDVSRQDILNDAVRDRIQAFMDSRGFPAQWSEGEYPAYFEKVFGDDKERQRKYLRAALSEEKVQLSAGSRVLGGLLAAGLCRVAFTTNFDSVIEKAVASVGKSSLAAYHIEGAHSAVQALNNEEFPLYCKLHGDFRYDSLKNLAADLAAQNADLSACMVNAGNRFGFVVAGYSGRDASVMALFRSVLRSHNPFPHGLFWTGIKGSAIPPPVEDLLREARERGVNAHHVAIETFDSLLLRLWRNIEPKPAAIDAEIRQSKTAAVSIPMGGQGKGKPILRLNALPIVALPDQCLALSLRHPIDWDALRDAERASRGALIVTKAEQLWAWGSPTAARQVFGDNLTAAAPTALPADFGAPGNQHFRGFIQKAIAAALSRGKPVQTRTTRTDSFLIARNHPEWRQHLEPLSRVIGATSGVVPGIMAPATDQHPQPEKVSWAEALRLSVELKDGQWWLLIDPDIWIFPSRARPLAIDFMAGRRRDRRNDKYNALLDAWIQVILGAQERGAVVSVQPFNGGTAAENPAFQIGSRTAFSRRAVA